MFSIGTVLVVLGALAFGVLITLGVPRTLSVTCGLILSFIGFSMQMYSAFSSKRRFEQEMKQSQLRHEAKLHAAASLPPEQAIALLLNRDLRPLPRNTNSTLTQGYLFLCRKLHNLFSNNIDPFCFHKLFF